MLSSAERILLWTNNLAGFAVGLFGPLYAVFADQVGGDILDISWVYALYLAIVGVGVIVVGKVSDRISPERIMVAGYALSAIATFGFIFVDSMTALFVAQGVTGLARAMWEPTWFALYDKHSGDDSQDGYIWGLASGFWYILGGIAMLIGGYIVAQFSFDMLFFVMGVMLTITTLYTSQMLRYRVKYKE